ncbi:MAG: hypothetical protein HF978_19990 [Desulfobacteraceae bacterium]|nr:hypothetical protein [Desulfobacteraceae bacterium]MBC2757828.1 hypothetical protein [Desulfobacteraceae bacterium]
MKTVLNIIIGMIIGVIIVCITGWIMMPKMMLKEYESPYSVEEQWKK